MITIDTIPNIDDEIPVTMEDLTAKQRGCLKAVENVYIPEGDNIDTELDVISNCGGKRVYKTYQRAIKQKLKDFKRR
jgi:hypothetical protein